MVSIATVRRLALGFPETDELPHFHRSAFRVKEKIFATLSEKEMTLMVKLSVVDQSVFCSFNTAVIYPVAGGWGRAGATFINLKKIKTSMFKDALRMAYCNVAPPALAVDFLP